MSTIRIAPPPKPPCASPEHNPPSMMVYEPGTWQHTCPSCGNVITFVVPQMWSMRAKETGHGE